MQFSEFKYANVLVFAKAGDSMNALPGTNTQLKRGS
jgi:hypothetical protein